MMKYWEVIKELTEDPTKKFEAKLSSRWTLRMSVNTAISSYFRFDIFYDGKLIDQSSDRGAFNGNVSLDDEWELVRQPVTWQEAIRAWAEGKTISYSYMGRNRQFLFEDSHTLMSVEKMKNAEWYVEE